MPQAGTFTLRDRRSPEQHLANHLKIQVVERQQPAVEHLRVYGCRAYVRIPDKRRQKGAKLDEQADQGILVGYKGQKGHIYRVYSEGQEVSVHREISKGRIILIMR
jgi:hypothetical protein